jgi:hypothetical protein
LHYTAKQQTNYPQNQNEKFPTNLFWHGLCFSGLPLCCFPAHSVGCVIDWTGSHQECQYGLMSFGIHLGAFPIDTNGMLKQNILSKYEVFSKFVVNQRIREQEARLNHVVSDTIESATNNDVLFGKSKLDEKNSCHEWP